MKDSFCLAPKFLGLSFHPASIILSLQLICSSKSRINTLARCEADADGALFQFFYFVPFNMRESSDGVNYSLWEQGRRFIWSLLRQCLRFGPFWPLALSHFQSGEQGDAAEGIECWKTRTFKCKSGLNAKREGSLQTQVLEVWSSGGRLPSFLCRRSASNERRRRWASNQVRRKSGKKKINPFVAICK